MIAIQIVSSMSWPSVSQKKCNVVVLYLNLNSYYSYTLIGNWNAYERTFSGKGLKFEASADLVGEVWDAAGGRPAASNNEVYELEIKYSGM